MPQLSLLVTAAEIQYAGTGRQKEQQIALRAVSPDLAAEIATITGKTRRELLIGGCIALVLGDRSAIWRAHNEERTADFDALFALLARRPGQEMRVLAELVETSS